MITFYDLPAITALHAEEYKSAISRVIDSGWFLQGRETELFEQSYASYIGTRHCIGVGNGLDALCLILQAYKQLGSLSDGDEVIVPANTFIATINAITLCGLKPILVEPTWENLNLDISRVEEAVTPRTRAVITVHLYGRLSFSDALADICRRHDLLLIEDNAQAQGCMVNSECRMHDAELGTRDSESRICRTGSLGHAAAHSFYPAKNLGALGDAGAVTTDDDRLAETIRSLANYGTKEKYVFSYVGRNSRISEIDAAVLSIKLRYLDDDNHHRQQIAAVYYDTISNPHVTLPHRLPDTCNVYHQFPVFTEHRDSLRRYLLDCGIETMIHYPVAPHRQECYASTLGHLHLPITERIHACEVSLPISPVITLDDAVTIAQAINSFSPPLLIR